MKKILIAGCGYVGNELGERLSTKGHKVWGIRRNTKFISESIQPMSADLSKIETLRVLPETIDYVFYMPSPGLRNEITYKNAFLKGTKNLVQCMEEKKYNLKRFFFFQVLPYMRNIQGNGSTKIQ